MTQNNLGNAYNNRIKGEKAQNIEEAIACLQEALRVFAFEAFPIHDTYAVDITLYYQNVTVPVGQFSRLNPQGCLLASTIQASLGQTLVLYGEPVGTPEEDRKLADACVDAFFQGTDQKPQFSASGQLFGSPIFAYDNGKEKPTEQCHLLVWLNRHPETLNLAQKTYFSLLNLLCCRSKILFAYDQARWCYRQTRGLYGQLEQEVQGFKELPRERKTRLEQLKQKLTEMPSKTFDYAGYLRDMEDHKTAIATNAANYNYWLKKISESSLKDDNIEFLEDFLNQRTELFQNQIQVNLNYLKPGQQLFDQMLGSIRGIVETEQAQQEKRLERWIASVGIGLAVSGISSQTDAKPLEAILIKLNPNVSIEKCPKAELQSCLSYTFWFVLFHVLLGVGVGAITALILGRK
ncbi:MAG: tetratricopeptide repeat protein [Moorea sp. SIO3I6]|nr:tetratricopeptide repeat protein [Moorena sp. SIO4A5]NEP21867.1 tetratricopeptide repeat protein [Moorena sp. SIO3I6]NEQ58497.1 tetratricopeptide repeat protein [Moorena sp. SIO4A1]